MRVGTVFSGIGAAEQALKRLGVPHEIIFACDNGDVEINFLEGRDLEEYKRLMKLRSRKELKSFEDIAMLQRLTKKELVVVDRVRKHVQSLSTKQEKKFFVDNLYQTKTRQKNFVRQSYFANYVVNQDDFHWDIRFLDGRDYFNQLDLLVGGSPCQSFSSVGAKGGLADTRGTLFYEFARIVKESQPKVFIYENVRGLLTHDDGNTWSIIRNVFERDLNYRIGEPQILNASDYGIPQSRRRLFVVGIRSDVVCENFIYPTSIPLKYKMQDFLEDNCASGEFRYNKRNGSLIVGHKVGKPDDKFVLTPAVQRYVLAGGTGTFKTSTKTDLPIARTLMKMMTQHHRAGVDNYITVQKNPLILRQLSDREALRLMGFPDDFKIVVSSMQMLRQAGNSIVVDVMMAILKELFRIRAIGL